MWASLTVHWGFESRDCVSFTFIILAPSEGFNRRLESFEWMNEKTFKVRSVSWRFVEQRCLGLVWEATVSPLHSFLSLCFCSCCAFSAQQILSLLCPELSSGFHLTLRKSQSFTWAPKALGPPDPISSYFWPPAHTAQATRNAPLPLAPARHSTAKSLCSWFASARNILPRFLHGSLLHFLRSLLRCHLLSVALSERPLPQVLIPFPHFILSRAPTTFTVSYIICLSCFPVSLNISAMKVEVWLPFFSPLNHPQGPRKSLVHSSSKS